MKPQREALLSVSPPDSVGPLRLLRSGAEAALLLDLLRPALSIGLLLSLRRSLPLLELAGGSGARLYLIGPRDFGQTLQERAFLKHHAGRQLCRRGLSCAADLLILNYGGQKRALLLLSHRGRLFLVELSFAQSAAAVEWFAHLFWHHTTEEGLAAADQVKRGAGYRFARCGPAPFSVPALPREAPLWLCKGALPPEGAGAGGGLAAHLPPLWLDGEGGHIDGPADGAEDWSVRLRLSPAQAHALRQDLGQGAAA